eukprot:Sspe_Gene.49498::Locus_26780_Transcript_1_1_Confidence_1.000_Length_1004::g.49498::m.49498
MLAQWVGKGRSRRHPWSAEDVEPRRVADALLLLQEKPRSFFNDMLSLATRLKKRLSTSQLKHLVWAAVKPSPSLPWALRQHQEMVAAKWVESNPMLALARMHVLGSSLLQLVAEYCSLKPPTPTRPIPIAREEVVIEEDAPRAKPQAVPPPSYSDVLRALYAYLDIGYNDLQATATKQCLETLFTREEMVEVISAHKAWRGAPEFIAKLGLPLQPDFNMPRPEMVAQVVTMVSMCQRNIPARQFYAELRQGYEMMSIYG